MTGVDAVILAGGLGTRLQPYTTFLPKPMLPLGDRPILEHLIEWIRKNRIVSVVLCVSYMKKTIQDYFGDGSRFNMNIKYAESDRPLATAGQLKTAQKLIDDSFVCMYGDSVYGFGLQSMVKHHKKKKATVTMGIYEYKTDLPYGVIRTAKSGRVTSWDEKPRITTNINMGCYIMEPEIFDLIPANTKYGMDDAIRKAISCKMLVSSYLVRKGFADIGDKESYERARSEYLQKFDEV